MSEHITWSEFESNGFHFSTKNNIAHLDYAVDKKTLEGRVCIPSHVTNNGNNYRVISIGGFNESRLTEVILPTTILSIYVGAFSDCFSIKRVQLNEGLEEIGSFAFSGCHSLMNIDFPCSLRKIGHDAFWGCVQLQAIKIPDRIEEIGFSCFAHCQHLQNLTLPSTLKKIGNYAFEDCNWLTEVVIPDTATSIGEGAFQSNNNLKEITIGKNVREIGDYAFSTYSLIYPNVYNRSITPQKITEETFGNRKGTLHVPMGSLRAYRNAPVWKNFKTILDDINI